jgi:3-hydroxyacyl-[acyl-carrier-protein] dehydratase
LLIYKLIESEKLEDGYRFEVVTADASHPIFKAHFPHYPLLPGFMQIDICQELLKTDFTHLSYAKFTAQILPDDKVTFYVTKKQNGYKVVTKKGTTKCGEFSVA